VAVTHSANDYLTNLHAVSTRGVRRRAPLIGGISVLTSPDFEFANIDSKVSFVAFDPDEVFVRQHGHTPKDGAAHTSMPDVHKDGVV
jgi:hypothetical protein